MICSSIDKGGRLCAFIQYYKSKHFDDIKKIKSKELCVKGNTCEIFEEYLKYKKKHFEKFEKEFEDQFDDFREEDEEGKQKYINEKLSNLRLHKLIQKIE